MRIRALSLFGAAVLTLGAAPEGRQLTLNEAISIGLKNATSVLRAENSLRQTGAQLLQGYLQFVPNLTAGATYGEYFGTTYAFVPKPQAINGTSLGATFQISSSINLFNGFSDISALRADLAKKSAADLSYTRAKQQIMIDITQAYLQVILDQRLLDISKKNFDASKHTEELLQEQTRVGVKDIANLFTQQAQTASDETAVVTAGNHLRTDIMHLLQRLRLEGSGFSFVDPGLSGKNPYDESHSDDELVRKALGQRQDLQASEQTAKAGESSVDTVRGGYYPHLDFGVNMYGLSRSLKSQTINGVDQAPFAQDPTMRQLRDNDNYSALLTLSWNIFDRGVTKAAVEKASYDAAANRYDYEDLRMQVITDVKQAREDYRGAISRSSAAKRGVIAAAKSLERIQARYGTGASTFLDLLTAQVALFQAENSEAQAQIDTALQALVISHALGETTIPNG